MDIKQELITNYNGELVYLFSLNNNNGCTVRITNFGAIIKDILIPQPNGNALNMVLSYPKVEDYFEDPHYIGCIVGRYANRIANGAFELNGKEHKLALNEVSNNNHLHGGFKGFNKKVWKIGTTIENDTEVGVVLTLQSPHLDEGYPGTLITEVQYLLNNNDELIVRYQAKTDLPTIVNLTNHSYFNLSGDPQNISDHLLTVKADRYTPANEGYIPSGDICALDGLNFDLREGKKVGDFMEKTDTLNYCLDNTADLKLAAVLKFPQSGMSLLISTTCPGIQLYCGNYLSGNFAPFAGICLEPQHYPDSPNHPNFPSATLLPGNLYDQTTIYQFKSSMV